MKELLQQLQDPEKLAELSRQTGVSEDDIIKVIALGVPSLVEGMDQNAQDDQGAEDLGRALTDHEDEDTSDSDSFLDRYLNKGEGGRMFKHIFPDKDTQVEEDISEKTGVQSDKVRRILSILAPLVLASMASRWSKRKKEDNRTDSRFDRDEIRDITRQAKKDTREEAQNGSLIDILNDLSSPDEKERKSGGILGDLLGNIFGN